MFRILGRLSKGQPCDISGLSGYEEVGRLGGVQWPYPEGFTIPEDGERGDSGHAERRLFADGLFFTPDQRARLVVEDPVPPSDRPNDRYPLVLLTGRGSSSQWHTQTRTAKSAVLRTLYPDTAYVEINPVDADALGIRPHEWVGLRSRRASMKARAFVTSTVAPGTVFVPMHYADTNRLTAASFDKYSRQPSYKYAAVNLHRLEAWER